jgi:hypothetical protein
MIFDHYRIRICYFEYVLTSLATAICLWFASIQGSNLKLTQ